MKSKLCYLILGAISLTFTSCETENTSENNSAAKRRALAALAAPVNDLTPCFSTELLAGEIHDAGDVKLYFDESNIYVEYQMSANWYLKKTHLYIGDRRLVPLTRLGDPRIEFFPISETLPQGTESAIYSVAKSSLNKCFTITAYAEVYRTENNGEIVQIENAWSLGERFSTENWGMYFDVCQTDCSN